MESSIYPNPSRENFSITRLETVQENGVFKSSLNEKETTSYFELYDFNNNLIKKGFLRNQLNIDASSYKKGRYILKIVGRKEETHYLIVK
jgi:hypothetical protein